VVSTPWLLPGLALAQAAGIGLADRIWLEASVGNAQGALWIASLTAVGLGALARPARLRLLLLLSAAAGAGAASHAGMLARADAAPVLRHVSTFEAVIGESAGPDARVLRELRDATGRQRLPRTVQLRWDEAFDDAPAPAVASALPGERWRLRGTLQAVRGLRNPGRADPGRAWRRRGVGGTLRLAHPLLAVRIGNEGKGAAGTFRAWRQRRARRLESAGPGGALLAALALGERSALSDASREAFAQLGLAHLLAVSGLHLSLVSGMVFWGVLALASRSAALAARIDLPGAALVSALLAAGGYALLTGPAIPVQRAFVLLAAAGLAVGSRRPRRRAHPLALASLLVLWRTPSALFEPSFQLSFAATAALLAAHPASEAGAGRALRERIAALLRVSAAAILATAPLSACHFGQVAPAGLLANLVAIPLTAFLLLPAAFLALLASVGDGALASLLVAAAARLAAALLSVASALATSLPVTWPAAPPSWTTLAVASGLAVLAIRRSELSVRVVALALQAALLAAAPPAALEPRPPRVVFFDVGQGDASLVQGRDGTLLVDAGPDPPGGFDAGRQVLLPALRALGVARLDRLAVSHADLDHRGGVPAVLDALPVGAVWIPPGGARDPAFAEVRAVAERRGVPVLERGAGFAAERLGDVRVEFLWPPPSGGSLARNDRSLVLRVAVGGVRVLLTGDGEAAAERALLVQATALRAEVLKLAHHGSRTSSSAVFLRAVAPRLAVASAPCAGRFGMPHAAVRERLAGAGVPWHWTGREGAVIVGLAPRFAVRSWGRSRRGCADRARVAPSEPGLPVFPGETR
jgi:competence protein ComEC